MKSTVNVGSAISKRGDNIEMDTLLNDATAIACAAQIKPNAST
jgi:hypothetical protein